MQEISFLLTEWQELNSLLYAPLSATKRVQYTCVAVSTNYIALGATSGSVYLFTREPCVFQHLIPLSEGAVYRAQISPDEKTIALSTVRGSVCLVSLKQLKLLTVSSEHLGEKVSSLCWNDSSTEVYAGDDRGKISVTVVPSFMVNGMFQSPSGSLMDLNSKIVQMNFDFPLLLVSTLNRCYICDTVYEQYKQIGNKPRDGEFGACFSKKHSEINVLEEVKKQEQASNLKQLVNSSEEVYNENNTEECLPKIYCARPGSRFWEVTSTGTVIKTHQFKEALAIPSLPVYKPSIGKLFRLKNQNQAWPTQSINFSQLFVINEKYLFSYTSNGLYILDPENAEVILWNDEFPDIFMAHIINDSIYLMSSSGVFHCLTFSSTDSLILQLYDKKLYKQCLDMCQILKPNVINSIAEDFGGVDLKEITNLPEVLGPIISLIKPNYNTHPIKLESGIVLVNSASRNSKSSSQSLLDIKPGEIQDIDELKDLFTSLTTNSIVNSPSAQTNVSDAIVIDEKIGKIPTQEIELHTENKMESNEVSSLQLTICNIQTDLESLYLTISSQMRPNITEKQLEELLNLFTETLDNLKEKYEVSNELQSYLFEVIRSAELHYYNSLLENLSIELLHKIENIDMLNQLTKIFIDINSPKYIECSCSFPYPVFGSGFTKTKEPKFFNVGKVLLNKLSSTKSEKMCLKVCNQIPYLWREYLSLNGYKKHRVPETLLKQCLQIRDNFILSTVLPNLDDQQWSLSANCFENIKNGKCVNCSKPYDSSQISSKDFNIDWPGVVRLIIQKHGSKEALAFLSKVHEKITQVIFDKSIYQSIIFSTILRYHGVKQTIELDNSNLEQNSICSPKVLKELNQSVEKDTEVAPSKDFFGSGPHHWGMRYNLASSTCPCCTLSLHTPVLLGNNGIALFPCGHAYHVNCMIQKKISRCNLHSPVK